MTELLEMLILGKEVYNFLLRFDDLQSATKRMKCCIALHITVGDLMSNSPKIKN